MHNYCDYMFVGCSEKCMNVFKKIHSLEKYLFTVEIRFDCRAGSPMRSEGTKQFVD